MSSWRIFAVLAIMLGLLLLAAFWWQPTDDLHGRTLLVWASDNNPARVDQITTFNLEHPQDKLELDFGDAGMQKVLLQCSSGIGPDIFDIYGKNELQGYVEAGVLWDVTSAADQRGFSAVKNMWPGLAEAMTYEGRQYAYPCNIVINILIYNKNVFDYYGVAYPEKVETWDQLVELGRKVSTEGTGKAGLDGPIYGLARITWKDFFASQRGEFFDPAGHLLDLVTNAELRKAFEWHRDLIFKHKLALTSVQLQSMGGQGGWGASEFNQFASGKFAMIAAGNYALLLFGRAHAEQIKEIAALGGKIEDIRDPLKRPLRLGSVLLPGFAGHTPCYEVECRMAGINPYGAHREQALDFLQYLTGPSYSSLINRNEDGMPGNPKYATLGVATQADDLGTAQIHQTAAQAMAFGYSPRSSPFLLDNDVAQVIMGEISRLESNPQIGIDELLSDAQRQLNRLLRRNLNHDPALKKRYVQSYAGRKPDPAGRAL